MMRTWLISTVTLAYLIGAGPASAQSRPGIVKDNDGDGMPAQTEWQQRAAGADARAQAPAPNGMPAQAQTGRAAASPAAGCLPPVIPALSELVSVGQHTLVAPVEGADETVTVTAVGLVRKDHLARYRLGETSLDFIIYFVRGHLAAVDDHPGDPTEPDLVDTGMVSRRGAALAQGTPMCQWERLPRTGRGGDRGVMPADRI